MFRNLEEKTFEFKPQRQLADDERCPGHSQR